MPQSKKTKNHLIAELAIKYASDAANYFDDVDEGSLRIQIAAALLKAVQMPDVINRLFPPFDNPIVDKLFADGTEKPDPDELIWDLV